MNRYFIIFLIVLFSFQSRGLADKQWWEQDLFEEQSQSFPFRPMFFDVFKSWPTFNFVVYYYNDDIADEVIANIDNVHQKIIDDLGYLFYYNPKHIKIYIYRTNKEYHQKTGMSQWAGGHSDFREGSIYTYEQKNLMQRVIVHELTHMIFDSYMGYPRDANINWLHEGLAVYEEKRYIQGRWNLRELKKLVKQNKVIPIRKAVNMSLGMESDAQKVSLWYFQMAALVAYMISLGQEGFQVFCNNLKRYKNIDEALLMTYPWDFKNLEELERKWKKWLMKQEEFL
ncbi:peptidase MA family metallohydrolase [bacterium]